ncbi:MAG: hypothetical protein IQL11_08605 [Bacteroidales bacterium]|nr:hypothetical protein [Bacteroidales bacterium]
MVLQSLMQVAFSNIVSRPVKKVIGTDVMVTQESRKVIPDKKFSHGVTVFPNIFTATNPRYMDLPEILNRIKNGNSKNHIVRIRAGETGLKNELSCICFSGIFTHRTEIGLIKHSGLICLDYHNPPDVSSFRERICMNPFTHAAFISPSGKGLKVIVRIAGNHTEAVRSLAKYFPAENLELKAEVSNICFESWDPKLYYNPHSLVFTP